MSTVIPFVKSKFARKRTLGEQITKYCRDFSVVGRIMDDCIFLFCAFLFWEDFIINMLLLPSEESY